VKYLLAIIPKTVMPGMALFRKVMGKEMENSL
jgi:hypothetical protein